MRKQKALDLIIAMGVWLLVSVPIHEWCHYWVAKVMGAEGLSVTFPELISGRCSFTSLPPNGWLIYLAGGLGTGLLMLLLAWRAWKSPTKWDWDDLFALTVIGGAQIGYGVGEVSLAFDSTRSLYPYLAGIGLFIGMLPALIFGTPKIMNWILE